jgi:iron complex outermembrane receptor protein
VSAAKGWDGFALDANIGSQRTDNYRDNNALEQNNFSGGMQWSSDQGRIGVRVDAARQRTHFPGALSLAEFESNPRQTHSPNDAGTLDMNRTTLFGERRLGDWDVAAELSYRDKTTQAAFVSAFGTFESKYDTRVTQFSPRVRHLHASGAVKNELVVGVDFSDWTRVTDSTFAGSPSSKADASQKAKALYARDEIKIGNARIALGARHESFDKKSVDPVPFTTGTYDKSQALNAWELQGNYLAATDLNLFAKAGRSYRMPNVDENGFTPIPNQPLEAQTSRDLELGASFGNAERKVIARVFQHRLRNEVFYDPTKGFGANVNLDPTKREGIELEASARLMAEWTLSANLQHVSAKFTEGPNAGKEMTLVPRNTASLRLNWLGSGQSADVGMQWADTQRYGGDFTNACGARIPSFTTLDARYAKHVGAWELAIAGANLTDKKYFTNAYGACQSGIYPDAGRQLKLSARLDF